MIETSKTVYIGLRDVDHGEATLLKEHELPSSVCTISSGTSVLRHG